MSNQIIQIKDGSDNAYPVLQNKTYVKHLAYQGAADSFSQFIMNAIWTAIGNLDDGEIAMVYAIWSNHDYYILTVLKMSLAMIYYRISDRTNLYVGVYEPGVNFELHTCAMAN